MYFYNKETVFILYKYFIFYRCLKCKKTFGPPCINIICSMFGIQTDIFVLQLNKKGVSYCQLTLALLHTAMLLRLQLPPMEVHRVKAPNQFRPGMLSGSDTFTRYLMVWNNPHIHVYCMFEGRI